jgi:hypothetical protein
VQEELFMKNSRYYPHERNRYFYGKLLTVRDFESEQKYFNDKRRLVNRLLFGSGVVCGLQVVAIDDQTITVEAGVALDSAGREIVVSSPVTHKLSMVEGFSNNEYAKNVYLCIAYDESGKEPVHSVAGASTYSEEVNEYNRIQEGYKVFVREEAPDHSSMGLNSLAEAATLIYQDAQVRIRQITPRYANPGDDIEITLIVEKTLQTPRIQVDYLLESEHFHPAGGGPLKVSFIEPEYGQKTEYRASFPLRAGDSPDVAGAIRVEEGTVRLGIGDKQLDIEVDLAAEVQIINGSIKKKIVRSYFDLPLDQCLRTAQDQCVYLAKISLLHMGRTYIIEGIEKVPFGEYVYNTSALYGLGLLEGGRRAEAGGGNGEADLFERVAATLPDAADSLGWEDHRGVSGLPEIKTGVAEIDLDPRAKAGKSYFSAEIEHGLGPGRVAVMAGLEDNDSKIMGEQIFYGVNEVFQDSPFQSSLPPMAIGTVVFPGAGTFRAGIRLQAGTRLEKITVRWWACRE